MGPSLRRFATAITLLLLGLPRTGLAQAFPVEEFDAYVRKAVSDWDVPGLAVAVVKDGQLMFARGYGVQQLGRAGAVDEHTRFAIGSTTKAMTAAALAMLVEEGKLDWNDPVIDHLPWFRLQDPWVTREIRVIDLLTHNAGLGNADFLWYEQDATTRDLLERLRYLEPAYSMRSGFIYQNLMYATAGEVIAAASGVPWARFIQTRILEPLGMRDTRTTLAETEGQPNVAGPHYRLDGTVERIENASVDPVAAAGSIWSSVHDMSVWLRFLLAGGVAADGRRLLEPSTVEWLFTPHSLVEPEDFYPTQELTHPHWTTYGLGWFQADYEGRKVDFHTGSIDGMVAIAGLLRDEGVGVYVLANRDHAEVRHALMYRVFDLYDPEAPRDWSADLLALYDRLDTEQAEAQARRSAARAADTAPSLPLDAYVGTFTHPLYGSVRIERDGARLLARYGRLQGTLEHWERESFDARWSTRWRGTTRLTFVLSGPEVTGVEVGGYTLPRSP
ncbi:MAG: serine hydrolase [Gemmatimonadota bacterium]